MKKSNKKDRYNSKIKSTKTLLLADKEMNALIHKIAEKILKEFSPLDKDKIALLGIQTKGVPLQTD